VLSLPLLLFAAGCNDSSPTQGRTPAMESPSDCSGPEAEAKLFAPSSFWNQPLKDDAPLDPRSQALVAELNRQVKRVAADGSGPWLGTAEATTPIYCVPGDQRTLTVKLDDPQESWRASLQRAFENVPVPKDAEPAPGADGHLTVWQPATDKLWEFFQMRRQSDGWHASWGGAIRHVSQSAGYYTRAAWPGGQSYWGATGTSLPVAGGVITVDELRSGSIDHALALNIPEVRAGEFSWPAQRSDGASLAPDAVPEGARFRLDPRLDLGSLDLHPVVLAIARAAQRYGIVVRDRSSTVAFYAEFLGRTRDNPYPRIIGPTFPDNLHELLRRFPWSQLPLLRMSLCTEAELQAQVPGPGVGECQRDP
jgi:hypothetical protein